MSDDQSVQSNTSPDFNLCNEPWIPVLYVSGQTQEVSLKQLFDESNSIRKIH